MQTNNQTFNPSSIVKKGVIIYRIGEVLFFIALLYMGAFLFRLLPESLVQSQYDPLIAMVICWGIGIPMVVFGKKIKAGGRRFLFYTDYINYLKGNKVKGIITLHGDILTFPQGYGVDAHELPESFSALSEIVKTKEENVKNEMKQLMDAGYLKDCTMDDDEEWVVIRGRKLDDGEELLFPCMYCGTKNKFVDGEHIHCVECGKMIGYLNM